MTRACVVIRCHESAVGFSTHCELHKRHLRRHGHPEQKGVTVGELRPFLDRVSARRTKNPDNPTWRLLDRRWNALTEHATVMLETSSTGSPMVSYERQAAQNLMSLRDSVPTQSVIDVSLGMFVFNEQRPGRFKSDKAFSFQLARRVRALADVNTGRTWSAKEGRVKRTYRDVPPRVLDCLAASLTVAFGVAGLRLAEMELREAAGQRAEHLELRDALKEMT